MSFTGISMKIFNPYTWSLETIAPQTNRSFKADLEKAVEDLYNSLASQASDTTKAKGNVISRVLVQNYNSSEARSKLLTPIAKVIEKHTNLRITTTYLDAVLEPNAWVSDSPVQIFLATSRPIYNSLIMHEYFSVPKDFNESIEWLASLHYHANKMDRNIGRFSSKLVLRSIMCIHSGFLDRCFVNYKDGVDSVVNTILHELGHLIDGVESSIRLAAVSELGDDILQYTPKTPTVEEMTKMLNALEISINKAKLPSGLLSKYKSAFKVLAKAEKKNDDWLATGSALYAVGVRELESRIGTPVYKGKSDISDSVVSSDFYKGGERRADKFATRHFAEDGNINDCNVFLNPVLFSENFNADKRRLREIIKIQYAQMRGNTDTYDSNAERALDGLKYKYNQISAIAKDCNSKDLKEYLERIRWAEELVKEMKFVEMELEKEYEFLGSVKKYVGRALTIFVSRNRLDQNSVLVNAARLVSRSALHSHAELLKIL